jgi:hypothetical protein
MTLLSDPQDQGVFRNHEHNEHCMKELQASENLPVHIFFQFVPLLTLKRKESTKDGIWGIVCFGYNHYFIMMPSLTNQHPLQRPAVLSGDYFLT